MGIRVGNVPPGISSPPVALTISSNALTISWSASLNNSDYGHLKRYHIYVNGTLDSSLDLTATSASLVTPLSVGDLQTVQVSAESDLGEGPLSPALFVKTIDPLPSVPNFRVSTYDQSSCSLAWDEAIAPANSSISGYKIEANDGRGGSLFSVV